MTDDQTALARRPLREGAQDDSREGTALCANYRLEAVHDYQ